MRVVLDRKTASQIHFHLSNQILLKKKIVIVYALSILDSKGYKYTDEGGVLKIDKGTCISLLIAKFEHCLNLAFVVDIWSSFMTLEFVSRWSL